jgi:glutathione peroxidase
MSSLFDFDARTLGGAPYPLSAHRGQVVLVVNTASQCGFTPQYEGLQRLHETYGPRGLVVLGFPCNQFGGQEPGSSESIGQFCQVNYGVSFPMMEKVEVNGRNAHPLFTWLSRTAPGLLGTTAIKWNFTKFLVSRDGTTVERFAPKEAPAKLAPRIEAALGR